MSNSLQPQGLLHAKPPHPSPTSRVYSNSCPLSQWCHSTISSSVTPCSSCLQSFPASGSFQMSQYFKSGGQSIGASASASDFPMNIQGWFSLGWTSLISLQSNRPWRVFSNTTVQKHLFFGAQPSLWSNSHHKLYKYLKPKIQSSSFSATCKASSDNHFAFLFLVCGLILYNVMNLCP